MMMLAACVGQPFRPSHDADPLKSTPISCSQCLPCRTPPCYKNDGVHDYSTNGPVGGTTGVSPCWFQRAFSAKDSHQTPVKTGVIDQPCGCDNDSTATQSGKASRETFFHGRGHQWKCLHGW